jgi:shikimate kinase
MSDYYGYAPLVHLQRPLLLCGLPGADVGSTARVITMLTGLPLCRLAHRVAHVVGDSHDRATITLGETAVLAREAQQLEQALAGRSPPVVALTAITLTDARMRRLALEQCDLIYLRLDVHQALKRIRQQCADTPSKHLAVRAGGAANDEEVLARLRFMDRLCRDAPRHVAIDGRLALDVGRALAAELHVEPAL